MIDREEWQSLQPETIARPLLFYDGTLMDLRPAVKAGKNIKVSKKSGTKIGIVVSII